MYPAMCSGGDCDDHVKLRLVLGREGGFNSIDCFLIIFLTGPMFSVFLTFSHKYLHLVVLSIKSRLLF